MERTDTSNYQSKTLRKELFHFSILDRYIIGKYVKTFLFTLILLSLIAIVFDVSERIEKFLHNDLTVWKIAKEYYLNFVPWINALMFPIYALITVIFFTSRMAGQTEIIPMFSAGMSYRRFLKPFFISGLLFTIIHLIGNHFIVPKGNKTLKEFENRYIKTSNIKELDRNIHFFVQPGLKAYVNYFQSGDSTIRNFQLEKYEGNKIVELLTANSLKWKSEPNIWTMSDYKVRYFSDSTERFEEFRGTKTDTAINFGPSIFTYATNQKEMMTTGELNKFIKIERARGSGITRLFEVERARRTADPFTTLILTMIGVCLASRKVRGGLGLHLALAMVLGVSFIFLSKLSLTFANNEIFSPVIAVWIPNIIFSFIAYYLYSKAQK